MKRQVFISDTHGSHDEIFLPEGDILFHCGDYSSSGSLQELLELNRWFGTLGFSDIVVIDGNHDTWSGKTLDANIVRGLFTNATYLRDEEVTIQGLRIYGSPWSKQYGRWQFMKPESELVEVYKKIPENLDILVTHGGPYGILDKVSRAGSVGSVALKEALAALKQPPKVHAFGHIHEGHGTLITANTTYVNASIMDEDYIPTNQPIEVIL